MSENARQYVIRREYIRSERQVDGVRGTRGLVVGVGYREMNTIRCKQHVDNPVLNSIPAAQYTGCT